MPDEPVFVDVWAWAYDFHARSAGDPIRSQIMPLFDRAWAQFEHNPDEAVALLNQGLHLAKVIDDPRWVLFFENWLADLAIWYRNDLKTGLDLAVRSSVEVRKPIFEHWPFAPRIHYELVSAYVAIDPLSYQDEIEKAVRYLDQELNYDIDVWRLVPSVRWGMAQARGDLTAMIENSNLSIARSHTDGFRLAGAYDTLCYGYYMQRTYDTLLIFSRVGETYARLAPNRRSHLASLQLWRVIGFLKTGDLEESRRMYQVALGTLNSLSGTPRQFQVMALPIYHEQLGEHDKALHIREKQREIAIRSGSPYAVYLAHLECCRLLKIMGQLDETTIAATREAHLHLKQPERYISYLDRILAGDTAEIL
jgi:hypothetical protein